MGKGSGACTRPGISLGVSDSTKTESTLRGDVASSEINTNLELQRLEGRWRTKDERATFQKREEGWVVFSFSDPVRKAFREYGLIHQQAGASSYEHTYFPSLKAARQAVTDVSLEAGLNIDSRLTRRRYVTYKIGDLPLIIKREKGHWRIIESTGPGMPASLKKDFHSIHAFNVTWEAANITRDHPTRKAAHQAVENWLAQTIVEGK